MKNNKQWNSATKKYEKELIHRSSGTGRHPDREKGGGGIRTKGEFGREEDPNIDQNEYEAIEWKLFYQLIDTCKC